MKAKNISKIVGLSSLLLMSTAATAGWQGNFLVGVEGGYAWRSGDLETNILNYGGPLGGVPRNLLSQTLDSKPLNDSAAFGGLLVGYQVQCNRILLGLEANFDWHGSENTKAYHQFNGGTGLAIPIHNNGFASYERGTTIGLSMRAGYQMTQWLMPYVRLGAESSDDTLRYVSSIQTLGGPTLPIVTTAEDSERSYRFVGGAGLEIDTYIDELKIRFEYNYVPNSKRVKAVGASVDAAPGPASPTQEHFVDTKQDQHVAKAALVYNF